jgi:hypothetical protein
MCQLCSFALRYQKSVSKAALLNPPSLSDAIGITDLTPVHPPAPKRNGNGLIE